MVHVADSASRRIRAARILLLVALTCLAWWFFGNLYEAVVISPNWIVDSPAQLTRLHEFFLVTGPTEYFIPASPVALLATWTGLALARPYVAGRLAQAAIISSALLAALTVVIVAVLVQGLFGADYLDHAEQLLSYATWWNAANIARLLLTATTGILVWRILHPRDTQLLARTGLAESEPEPGAELPG